MAEVTLEDAGRGDGNGAERLGLADQAALTVGVGWWHTGAHPPWVSKVSM